MSKKLILQRKKQGPQDNAVITNTAIGISVRDLQEKSANEGEPELKSLMLFPT